jgi:glutathione S-transferase
MKLYYSPTSPFVRKVNVFAREVGLDKEIEWVKTNPWLAEDILTAENPLSKIPTLITDDGLVIYDSRVICEYLDTLHKGDKFHPENSEQRWPVLRLQALADGILESGILRFLEAKRLKEQQSIDWDTTQKASVERGLDYLESTVSDWRENLDIGVITVACALGWLDFRIPNEDWRTSRPQLKEWFVEFSKRESMLTTMPAEPK